MPVGSSAFSSFGVHRRSNEGINGALTPARPHRQRQQEHKHHDPRKNTNDIHTARSEAAHPNTTDRRAQNPSRPRQGGRSNGMLSSGVGGEGISLQETEARIGDLERREFDLKLKLFYMEEQLEEAAGGADPLQLHKEVMDAKLHRAHAEEEARAAGEDLSGMEVKCRELEMQVRAIEAQRANDRENWAMLAGESETRMKKHALLLEAALRTERAENARLRLEGANRRASWDGPGGSGSGVPGAGVGPQRKSAGEDATWKVSQTADRDSGGSSSSFGREHREQQLAARLRSQDSLLRSSRADVTMLRRQLRKQREENDGVRTAAEQVACVEAEEIARLAVDLERAVHASNAEAEKRREAEARLEAAQTRLRGLEAGGLADGDSPPPRSRPKVLSPRCAGSSARGRAQKAGGEGGGTPVSPLGEDVSRREDREASCDREACSIPPPRGALGSTVASRARCTRDRLAGRRSACSEGGAGRSPGSPRRGRRDSGMKEKKRPWGSSPPPSPRRGVRSPGGAGAVPAKAAEHRRFPLRHSDEKQLGVAARGTRTTVGDGADPTLDRGRTRSREGLQEASARKERHNFTGGREADACADGSREYSVTERTGVREALALTGEERIAGPAADWRRPTGDGRDTPAAAASYLGVDLTATIARELRAAVATTPASTVSPGSGNFKGGGGGQNTPAVGGGHSADARARIGGEHHDKKIGSVEEEGGDLLKSVRRGGSKYAWDDVNPGIGGLGESLGDGRGLKSREVAELESDVQHIFQFFAAKDGRKCSGLPSNVGRGDNGATDVIADIAKALS